MAISPMSDPAPRSAAEAPDALATFLGKWRARWPEWAIAEVFLPPLQREAAVAWAVLQQELTDAAWGGGDARPGEAKLLWWQEELHGWSAGRRRHPLGAVLQRHPAPWAALARTLPALAASRERPQNLTEARVALHAYADAAAIIDARLAGKPDAGGPEPADVAVVTATLLQARFANAGDALVPLDLLACAGADDPVTLYARQLAHHWPLVPASTRPRRLWAALARARLKLADPTTPLPPWRALPVAWRAARAGRD